MAAKTPLAFLSYPHSDDAHENGKLRIFAERLSGEVRLQWGVEFPIFIDRNDLKWGQHWKARIEESLDGVTFLIPILTPGYFKSEWCRKELRRFVEREANLNRNDLILALYYVRCPVLEDEAKRAADDLAQVLHERQYVVVEATGKEVVLFQASMGRVANLTLRQAGGGDWFAVDIGQGRLDLEDCDISSQSLSAVAVRGGAEARVRRNRIRGNREGIRVHTGGRGNFENNVLEENKTGAWDIAADCEANVKRSGNLES